MASNITSLPYLFVVVSSFFFSDGDPIQNEVEDYKNAPATTAISDKISKDLKKKGFKFVGSTVLYAHMQATGMVNDHLTGCFRHREIQ